MATKRQIAANRRNAKSSTGPKSETGNERSSKNSFRHGLSVPNLNATSETHLKRLACQLVGDEADAELILLSVQAAYAQIELERARSVQEAMIKGALSPRDSGVIDHPSKPAIAMRRIYRSDSSDGTPVNRAEQQASMLRYDDEIRDNLCARAIRSTLSELTKIARCETRAAARRDRMIRKIASVQATAQDDR